MARVACKKNVYLIASGILLLAAFRHAGAAAPPEGVRAAVAGSPLVSFSPTRVRVRAGQTFKINVIVDFSNDPTTGGGIEITWDPTIFATAEWSYDSSTLNDDPAQRGTPQITPGKLEDVSVASFTGLTTPGIMGTLALTPVDKSCETIVALQAGRRPWVSAVDFQTHLNPVYGHARVGVGDEICAEAPIDPADAQMRGRCVAIRGPAQNACPFLTGWRESPLFESLPIREDLGIVSPLAGHMARYCLYQRSGFDDGNPADCGELQEAADRVGHDIEIAPALMAASPQGPLTETLAPEFESHFFAQAGKPLGDLPSPSPAARLWVVSLDTAPRTGQDPLASHGPVIGRIISELTEIGTAGDFKTLALPFLCFSDEDCLELCGVPDGCPSPIKAGSGGFMGTPESVAAGLHTAIGLWAADGGAIQRMIFNASLGWPVEFNEIEGEPGIGYLALIDALKEAACLGAPVIAAAGNAGSGPTVAQGLLSPAAEYLNAAPSLAECNSLGYLPDPADFTTERPLVYAVGAVRANGTRLLSRVDAEPELVAYADHATALTTLGESVMSGSSVSSAVAAATAGLMWSYDLTVPPQRVMEILYESADPVGRSAEVCPDGPPCRNVRRISVCKALLAFCAKGAPDCPTPEEVDCPEIHPTQLTLPDATFDALDLAFSAAPQISVADYQPVVAPGYDESCNHAGGYTLYAEPGAQPPLYPCPQDLFYDVQAKIWAKGQPEGQNCETCSIVQRSPAKLYVEMREDFGTEFDDPTLSDATLVCRHPDTGDVVAFRIPGSFVPGAQFLVTDIDAGLCPGEDIALAFSVADGAEESPVAMVQPLYVIRPDLDVDGVPDFRDNCIEQDNPDQIDSNADGYGNRCDPDLNDDGVVNFLDLGEMKSLFFTSDADADLTGDGFVNFEDLGIMKAFFFGPPGPSGDGP